MPSIQGKNWHFTLNNYTDDDLKKIDDYASAHPDVFILYGFEVGKETGTPHLQGCIHYPKVETQQATKKYMPRGRIRKCTGTIQENITYCSKEKEPKDIIQYGKTPISGPDANRNKAKRFIELAKLGDFATIEQEMPAMYASRYRTMQQIATDHMIKPADLEAPCGIWIYGESGCGKTTAARTQYGAYYSKPANKWWDGYQGEETVIIEDLDPDHKCLGHHLKLWTDKWSFPAEVKGGMRCLRPKRVIITSQYSISEVWPDQSATVEALTRRCEIIHMHKNQNQIPSNKPSAASGAPAT